jgi:FtsP/CotA-like multicopper oxidase with cupredoxin domain
MLIVGPGQREGLLLQFDSPGTYRVMQYLINDIAQIYNESSVPTAFIQVIEASDDVVKPVDISSLKFTPGMNMSEDIMDSEIEGHPKKVTFAVAGDNTTAPFFQFEINDELFDVHEIKHTMNASSASEWNLTSIVGFHPFHIQ